MNKYLIAAVMAVLVGVGYSQRSEAAACPAAGTMYSVYLAAGFTCDIGDKTFNNFTYLAIPGGGATAVLSTAVLVTPQVGPPNWGFLFSFGLSAGPGQTNDIQIGYTVTCNGQGGPFNCITSDSLQMVGGATGTTGTATVSEVKCLNANTIVNCPPANTKGLNVASPAPLSATVTFSPVHMESLFKDILVTGGNGTSQISAVFNTVDQVPEPATLALLGAGLASIAALRRRKALR